MDRDGSRRVGDDPGRAARSFFTRSLYALPRSICRSYAAVRIVPPFSRGATSMDIVYLALLAVLVGLSAAYITLCAKLEDRK